MLVKLKLKNTDSPVTVDSQVFEYLTTNPYLVNIGFVINLREHSLGYTFFQKHWRQVNGTYKVETIYLHRLIAERFMIKPESNEPLYVQFKNGNNKDCRLENLEWVVRSKLIRNTKYVQGKTKFRGVSETTNGKFKAVIYVKNKRHFLGRFDTAEEAAYAYNLRAEELYGKMRSLNKIEKKVLEKIKLKFDNIEKLKAEDIKNAEV